MINEVIGNLLFTSYFQKKTHVLPTQVMKTIHINSHRINKYDPGKIYFPKLDKHSKIIFIHLFTIKKFNDLINKNVIKLDSILQYIGQTKNL